MCPDVPRCAQVSAGERTSHSPHCGAARLAVTSCPAPRPALTSAEAAPGRKGGSGKDLWLPALPHGWGQLALLPATGDRTRGNGLTAGSGWTSGSNSSPKGLWSIHTGCRAAAESPALVAFNRPVDVAPGDRVQWWTWQCEVYPCTSAHEMVPHSQ